MHYYPTICSISRNPTPRPAPPHAAFFRGLGYLLSLFSLPFSIFILTLRVVRPRSVVHDA